jgi:hypothetical protein
MSRPGPGYRKRLRPVGFADLETIMDNLANHIAHAERIIRANEQFSKHLEEIINAYHQSRIDNSQPSPENKE